MEFIFLLIRLPFFLMGFLIYTALVCLIGPFVALFLFILKPLGRIVFVTPFKFLEAAFSNKTEVLTSYFERVSSEWNTDVSNFFKDWFAPYGDLFRWLTGESKSDNS